MRRQPKGVYLNCFSPPVMVVTLLIELALLGYAIWRYKLTVITRLIIVVLFALATFQLSEYFVCTGVGSMTELWSRIGFVAITVLPPLGLHITHVLANKPNRRLIYIAYASMAAFIALFTLAPSTVFTGHECTGNYVIFQFSANVTGAYSVYYFGWLAAGIGLGMRWAGQLQARRAKNPSVYKRLHTVQGMILGYLVFLVPSAIFMTVDPSAQRGIPSVLCGFAVLLALILTLFILPRAGKPRISP